MNLKEHIELKASNLNTVSDALSAQIVRLNKYFQQLNIGLSVWVNIYKSDNLAIGYAKCDTKWGIIIRSCQDNTDRYYHFNEAPRELRVRTVRSINKLIATISEKAEKCAHEIVVETQGLKSYLDDFLGPELDEPETKKEG
jgi:ribosome-associated translation inhibitor RaiA